MELSQLGSMLDWIRERGAEVVAIAVTPTFAQMAFARSLGVEFPLLSDWGGRVADAYGVRYETWKGHEGVAKRSVFLIDPDGVVVYSWHTEDALVLPDLTDLREALEALTGASS